MDSNRAREMYKYFLMLVNLFLDEADGAVYYLWNGTPQNSKKKYEWSYQYIE